MKMMPRPLAFRSFMILNRCCTSPEDRALVGSSMTSSFASYTSARAMATSCCLAVDREPSFAFRSMSTPRMLRARLLVSSISFQLMMRRFLSICSLKAMFSFTVSVGNSEKSW